MEATISSVTKEAESKAFASDAEPYHQVEEENRKTSETTSEPQKLPGNVDLREQNASGIGEKQEVGEVERDNPVELTPQSHSKEDSGAESVTNELMKDMLTALLRSQTRREILQEALDFQRADAPTTAALYCPQNGRPHSQMVEFGVDNCPLCRQKLRKRTGTTTAAPESTTAADPRPDPFGQHAKHYIEYLDVMGNSIFSQSQPKPFDLKESRGTGAGAIQPLVFEVFTALSTSLKPPMGRQCKNLELAEPFQLIAHHSEELELLRDRSWEENKSNDGQHDGAEDSNKLASIHLGMLMKFTDTIYNNSLEEERLLHARGLCTFRMLWLLFKPGTTVYRESHGRISAHVVQDVEVDDSILTAPPDHSLDPCVVNLWHLDFDGRYVGRCMSSVTVGEFEGERQITSLKVYPTKFIDEKDGGKLRQQIEKRGRRWYELLRGGQAYHSGELVLGLPVRELEGRIYIDPASHYLTTRTPGPEVGNVEDYGKGLAMCPCEECFNRRPHPTKGFRWSRYDVIDPHKERDLTLEDSPEGSAHRYLLCAWETSGFVLKSRTWERVDISCCSDHKPDLRAMDKLVMPSERKELIKALVQKFSRAASGESSKAWGADFIESKGEGRVFLLHGSPGVGKTYAETYVYFIKQTAECIAEFTDRALLSLTCADIGTNEVKMESQLSHWFRLAEQWGAVMLIDEADVFLEQRSKTDLHRNSLVSVFLRCIEYYRGILFLTTNRVGHFDDAFVSRIHVILSYDDLGEEQRRNIWEQFFDKLCDEREDFSVTKRAKTYVLGDEDDAICKLRWNGREIRNVFQTAVALAEYRYSQKANKKEDDQPVLDQKDFEQVCMMTQNFKKYLDNVHGANENERAFSGKARALDI